jgi:hypothetical protein
MDRRIKSTKKDSKGNVIALCNPDESWSPVTKDAVLRDIRGARRSYYVQELPQKAYVRAERDNTLQTTSDKASKNNLDNLPSNHA